jgi:hypothetical protein
VPRRLLRKDEQLRPNRGAERHKRSPVLGPEDNGAAMNSTLSPWTGDTPASRPTTKLSDGALTVQHAGAMRWIDARRSIARGQALYANRRSLQRLVRRQHDDRTASTFCVTAGSSPPIDSLRR